MVITKHVVLVLAKVAPLLGGLCVVLSFQTGNPSALTDAWRIIMSVSLGVFVTLVGAIYQNLNRRLESLEADAEEKFVSRREYDIGREDLRHQLDRIEGFLRPTRQ